MFNRQQCLGLALASFVLGLLASLLSTTIDTLDDKTPLSTAAAQMGPIHTPEVATPPPDRDSFPYSRKDFETLPPMEVIQPVINPAPVPTSPVTTRPVVVKPKASTVRAQSSPAFPVTATSSAEKAVAYALSKLGRPYVWGATGPNAFDCSGLVQAAFKAAGISLPRTTKTIISRGMAVSRNALQRGDLVWTGSGHMGIYVGDNKMVHAPQTGDVVKVQTIWAFYAARRV